MRPDGSKADLPSHVPVELVTNFDLWQSAGMEVDPFGTIRKLWDGPRAVYRGYLDGQQSTSHHGWLLTRSSDIIHALKDWESFSSRGQGDFSSIIGESWPLGPSPLDPPEHGKYREILNHLFTPQALAVMEGSIREHADTLIGQFLNSGRCEFLEDFARPFAIKIFMQLMGLPIEDYALVKDWEFGVLHQTDTVKREKATRESVAYIRRLIRERNLAPAQDLISIGVHGKIDGRPLCEDEALGLLYQMFLAGLDTVANTLAFIFRYIAQHPEQQVLLKTEPLLLRNAVEEFLRYFSVIVDTRVATRDMHYAGVSMKAGDRVMLPTMLAFDHSIDDPGTIDLRRKNANRHVAFGAGAHLCLGQYLARRELAVALEAWIAKVPIFKVTPSTPQRCHGGQVFGMEELHLDWSPPI